MFLNSTQILLSANYLADYRKNKNNLKKFTTHTFDFLFYFIFRNEQCILY